MAVHPDARHSRTAAPVGVALATFLILVAPVHPARAEFAFEVVKSFVLPEMFPGRLVEGRDGGLYGTTPFGGDFGAGTIFRIDGAGSFTRLHSFARTDGARPNATLLVGSDGALYGTTQEGGSSGHGTVFRIDAAGRFTSLHSFTTYGALDGEIVLGSDGAIYGTVFQGSVFRIDDTGSFTSFGFHAEHLVLGRDGKLYGTSGSAVVRIDGGTPTELGVVRGAYARLVVGSDGRIYGSTTDTVFEIDDAGSVIAVHSFDSTVGFPSTFLVVGSDGALYGTTQDQGNGPNYVGPLGVIYRIDRAGNFTTLHTFDFGSGEIPGPYRAPLVVGSDGALYGTLQGAVFRIDDAGTFTIHLFDANPAWGLVLASDGALYGTTNYGGSSNHGEIFKIESTGDVRVLHSFGGGEDGLYPEGPLVVGSDGALYGYTTGGGSQGYGTIFRVDGSRSFSPLYSFAELAFYPMTDASEPLVLGKDGALYGTTKHGGLQGWGSIFRVDPTGTVATLHSFEETKSLAPVHPLVVGGDGSLYGTTEYGATSSDPGTIYRVDGAGNFTSLHAFDWSDGPPPPPLIAGNDGGVYGTTRRTVFEIDGTGALNPLHTFEFGSSDCDMLYAQYGAMSTRLVAVGDGAIYGINTIGADFSYFGCSEESSTFFRIDASGGFASLGNAGFSTALLVTGSDGAFYGCSGRTVFKVDSSGIFTPLHVLSEADQECGPDPVLMTSDGTLYGATNSSVYRIDRAGAFTTVYAFDEMAPGRLTLGSDCALYGTVETEGPGGAGFIYRLYEPGHLCQEIRFDPLSDRTLGDEPFAPSATSSSGLPVSFTASGSCTVDSDRVTLTGVGLCTVTASQSGDANYQAAPDVSQSFHVLFDFTGFLRPVLDPPVVNRVKAGRTVPIRFSLGGDQGRDVLAAGSPSVRAVPCDAGAPVNDVEGLVTVRSSSLLHAPRRGTYTYLWKTDPRWAGTCQELSLELVDGSVHRAIFQLLRPPRPRGGPLQFH